MFEVITQSQPQDVQSLEILKEAYSKLAREPELIATSKRIAQAYVAMGQLSSAILEFEGVLQLAPEDPEAQAALADLESRTHTLAPGNLTDLGVGSPGAPRSATSFQAKPGQSRALAADIDDGRQALQKIFVEGKIISAAEFDNCWVTPDLTASPGKVIEPFVQRVAEKGFMPLDKALRVISDKARVGYLPLEKYDADAELVRSFPKDILHRWCLLPFDRMSKSVFVATTNPFNKQAAAELEQHTKQRLIWYLSPPQDIAKIIKKIVR
jgi:tetratricopeptide (TPR) repeat protein